LRLASGQGHGDDRIVTTHYRYKRRVRSC
jgi:hypothetical protein